MRGRKKHPKDRLCFVLDDLFNDDTHFHNSILTFPSAFPTNDQDDDETNSIYWLILNFP